MANNMPYAVQLVLYCARTSFVFGPVCNHEEVQPSKVGLISHLNFSYLKIKYAAAKFEDSEENM